MPELNIFIDWALKKDHVAVIEENSYESFKSDCALKFSSMQELLDSIKKSTNEGSSIGALNFFIESGAPYLFLSQLTNLGKVAIVDGKDVKTFRGERPKTDENDAHYIKELYHQTPDLFKELSLEDKQTIQGRFLVAKYIHFTKAIARLKTQQRAFERQFGDVETYKILIDEITLKKKQALKDALPYLVEDSQKINIHGIGDVLTMQILSTANPKKFTSLSAYLAYCGYIGNVGTKYNRLAKTTAYLMAKSCIMHKHESYYPLYIKIKGDLALKFTEDSKAKINGKAINRLSTFILKEIYRSVKQ